MVDVLYVGRLAPQVGGASRTCAELLAGLAGAGCRVRALSPRVGAGADGPEPLAGGPPGLQVTHFPLPYLEPYSFDPAPDAYRALQTAGIGRLLPRLIAARRPDVILVGRESDVWSVPDLARAQGVPCVAIGHGVVLAALDGWFRLGRELLAECRKLDLLIACAEHMAARLRERGFERVAAIPHGIDLERFRPGSARPALRRRFGIAARDTVVLHVSNLRPVKRPLDLVAAAARARASCPRLTYVVAGGGAAERAAMEHACRAAGVRDRFRLAGPVGYGKIPALLRLADMVVMPSESEGRARVYLEAQASGRLLLASDIPAARDVIVPGETGLLFRRADTDDLAAKLRLGARDAWLRRRIGRAARARARTHYRLADAVSAYAATLEAVARRATGRSR